VPERPHVALASEGEGFPPIRDRLIAQIPGNTVMNLVSSERN
jgi:hypothetical protein